MQQVALIAPAIESATVSSFRTPAARVAGTIVIALLLAASTSVPLSGAKALGPIAPGVDLGPVTGGSPLAINNRGDVVGIASFGDQSVVGFLWNRRTGFHFFGSNVSPVDINDRGQIVGNRSNCAPGGGTCAASGFLWTARDGFRDLGSLIPVAINNRGEIAGSCGKTRPACVWYRGVIRVVGGPNTYVSAINDRGDVVGGTFDLDGPLDALLINRKGTVVNLGPGVADDVNNARIVSGWESGIDSSAAAWVNGTLVSLGNEPSSTSAVNASGWVLISSEGFGFVRNVRTGASASLMPESADPVDINDRGEIVGVAHDEEGNSRMVIWRLHGPR
jgi:uncharacterized membrane protein